MLLGRVSANVELSKERASEVAVDLAAAHDRADAHVESEPGSAADAFSKRPPTEEQ